MNNLIISWEYVVVKILLLQISALKILQVQSFFSHSQRYWIYECKAVRE